MKTIDTPEQPEDELNEGADDLQEEKDESGLYKHIRDAEKSTNETIDAATQVILELKHFSSLRAKCPNSLFYK